MDKDVHSRTLVYIPIVHSHTDLGSLGAPVKDYFTQHMGPEEWERRRNAIDQFWEKTRSFIFSLNLDFSGTRLYQDGLPVCGKEQQIVQDLAQTGSPNYVLLQDLIDKGARLTGTESAQLLVEEYHLVQQTLADLKKQPTGATLQSGEHQAAAQRLLAQRDDFIARRIDATLQGGETGLVFLGALHSLKGRLPRTIHVIKPTDPAIQETAS